MMLLNAALGREGDTVWLGFFSNIFLISQSIQLSKCSAPTLLQSYMKTSNLKKQLEEMF